MNLGRYLVQHFTNSAGVQGITGIDPSGMDIGDETIVSSLAFGQGLNRFPANHPGDIFVTEIGRYAAGHLLQAIGVFGDRQAYVVEFARESAFASNVTIMASDPARSIFTIPGGSVFGPSAGFSYRVTRVR